MIRRSKQPVADFGLTFSSCSFHFDENTDNIAYNYTDNMTCNIFGILPVNFEKLVSILVEIKTEGSKKIIIARIG